MTVRVTVIGRGDETVLKVDGWLGREDTEELSRALRDCPHNAGLDLSELRFATPEGLEMLRRMRAEGTRLLRPRPFLSLLLGAGEVGETPSNPYHAARTSGSNGRSHSS